MNEQKILDHSSHNSQNKESLSVCTQKCVVPELPDDLYYKISNMAQEYVKESIFILRWVKMGNIFQVVISLDFTKKINDLDINNTVEELKNSISKNVPESRVFSILKKHEAAKNFQIRLDTNEAVASISEEQFFRLCNDMTNDVVKILNFTIIENAVQSNTFFEVPCSIVESIICRKNVPKPVSKAFVGMF